jgi:hypothetical protein
MKIVRTIVWVLLLVALLLFSVNNWEPGVTVKIWENLVVDTKLPAVVVISFLIGLVPMWLLYRANKWNYDRRIASLESAARASAMAHPAPASAAPPEQPRPDLAPADETKPAP